MLDSLLPYREAFFFQRVWECPSLEVVGFLVESLGGSSVPCRGVALFLVLVESLSFSVLDALSYSVVVLLV